MFHNFRVKTDHRNYLRFLWHPNSDLSKPLEEFRMTVHVFGNSPSPAVATYGLRRSVQTASLDVQKFVSKNFYVDDGLISCSSVCEAVDLVKNTQSELMKGGRLRLHKIASNSTEVLKQFAKDDLAKDLKNIDIDEESLPLQRSLGISWDINLDAFVFSVDTEPKPFTRRGVLSTINSLFDPIGFTAPVTLEGKLLLREIMSCSSSTDWDDPLEEDFHKRWKLWVDSLKNLCDLRIPRMYCIYSVENASRLEAHVFCDASKEAVAAVAYLKVFSGETSDIGFLIGKTKVAPKHGHTIPRLELCAAVLGIDIAEIIKDQLDIDNEDFHFYTDSQIVLGYISNDEKRFFVYVANRVGRIRAFSMPKQWNHIPTKENPADLATRPFSASDLPSSKWIRGPSCLTTNLKTTDDLNFPLVDPDIDKEVRTVISTAKSTLHVSTSCLLCNSIDKFSKWSKLVCLVRLMKGCMRRKSGDKSAVTTEEAEIVALKHVQNECFHTELEAIGCGQNLPKNSSLISLNPILDNNGVLRVGGRIRHMLTKDDNTADLPLDKHPYIIPRNHHVAILLIRHYHAKVQHQGRTMTEGAIRSAGLWILGVKRKVNSVIHNCVLCRKLRGKLGWTQMADLPADRLQVDAPFTYVGLDVFGPWQVIVRRTRAASSSNKRWGLLLTCLVSRAIHVELIEELSSASFINALRRFIALRGPIQELRSDRGTNFVGAAKELNIVSEFVEDTPMKQFLSDNEIVWIFNPPHASHFGGVWERMIGSCRRILDSLLLQNKFKDLTHEVLSTLMCEVSAMVNSRPLVPVSSDPENPSVLSPSLLLTQKPASSSGSLGQVEFGTKDAMRSQWKLVQYLADQFWSRWQTEYIDSLQARPKWKSGGDNFLEGDVILMRKTELPRSQWPLGVIDKVFESDDSKVRKVQVSIVVDGQRKSYVRPISELVRLIEAS